MEIEQAANEGIGLVSGGLAAKLLDFAIFNQQYLVIVNNQITNRQARPQLFQLHHSGYLTYQILTHYPTQRQLETLRLVQVSHRNSHSRAHHHPRSNPTHALPYILGYAAEGHALSWVSSGWHTLGWVSSDWQLVVLVGVVDGDVVGVVAIVHSEFEYVATVYGLEEVHLGLGVEGGVVVDAVPVEEGGEIG